MEETRTRGVCCHLPVRRLSKMFAHGLIFLRSRSWEYFKYQQGYWQIVEMPFVGRGWKRICFCGTSGRTRYLRYSYNARLGYDGRSGRLELRIPILKSQVRTPHVSAVAWGPVTRTGQLGWSRRSLRLVVTSSQSRSLGYTYLDTDRGTAVAYI
jgi:hypothetical protein